MAPKHLTSSTITGSKTNVKHHPQKSNQSPTLQPSPGSFEKQRLKQLRELIKPPVSTLSSSGNCTTIQIEPVNEVISQESALKFSIVIPVYPPCFSSLGKLFQNISDFVIDKEFAVSDVIVAASEAFEEDCKKIEQQIYSAEDIQYTFPIKILGTTERCYPGRNRNRARKEAKGDWIVFLDCEEEYHPLKLSCTYKAIKTTPDVSVFVHRFKLGKHPQTHQKISAAEKEEWRQQPYADKVNVVKPELRANLLWYNEHHIHHGVVTVNNKFPQLFIEHTKSQDTEFCRQCYTKGGIYLIDAELMIFKP